MIDKDTIVKLAELRRQIREAEGVCGETLDAMARARGQARAMAAATPFLTDCANELEALAGVVRQAAAEADLQGATP